MSTTSITQPRDCALVVGGYSSGGLYAREFKRRGIAPVHIPASETVPAAYAAQGLSSEFVADLPFEPIYQTVGRFADHLPDFRPKCVVAGTDQGVARAEEIAEAFRLPGNGSALSEIRRDKYLAIERITEAGLNAPSQYRATKPEAIADWVREHPEIEKWVVKPTRSAGSDRVSLCTQVNEVVAAARLVVGGTNVFGETDESILVQEYLTSDADDSEYVVNTCSAVDPRTDEPVHRIVSVYRYEKINANNAPFIYYRRRLLQVEGDTQQQLIDYFLRCLDALSIRHGPCHGELRMTNRGPALVEANVSRPDGGGVPALDQACTGADQITLTVDALLDPQSFIRAACHPYRVRKQGSVAFLLARHSGVLQNVNLSKLQELPSYVDHVLLPDVGESVIPTIDVSSLLGWVFMANEDAVQLESDYAELRHFERELFEID